MRRVAVGFTFGPVALFMLIMVMIYSRAAAMVNAANSSRKRVIAIASSP